MASFSFDSLRAHNGCLSLFELKDLTQGLGQLSTEEGGGVGGKGGVKGAATSARPRQFRFQRVVPHAAALSPKASTTHGPVRVLLPALQFEDDKSVAATEGIVFIVQDDSKVRVLRDRRTQEDLRAAFQDVDDSIVNEVWNRTHLFAAASTILTSLRNNGHTGPREGETDLMLDCCEAWPALDEACYTELLGASLDTLSLGGGMEGEGAAGGEGEYTVTEAEGWEHVTLPTEGDQWVLVGEEEEEPSHEEEKETEAADLTQVNLQMMTDLETQNGGPSSPTTAGTSLNYRAALVSNLMEVAQGSEWPAAPIRPLPSHLTMPAVRRSSKIQKKEEDGDHGSFLDEYYLTKAVSVRTRKSGGRKRLTETGKRRMAAKAAKRAEEAGGRGAPRGADGVEDFDDDGSDGDW